MLAGSCGVGWVVELGEGIRFGSWKCWGMGIEGWVGIGIEWFGDLGGVVRLTIVGFCVWMLSLRWVEEGVW